MKDLISISDLSTQQIQELIDKAQDIIANPDDYCEKCHRKKLATLFFEPSTRTRLSFEAAMLELGGSVLGFSEAASSKERACSAARKTASPSSAKISLTVLPNLSSKTWSVSRNLRPIALASSRPMVVFPVPIKPMR